MRTRVFKNFEIIHLELQIILGRALKEELSEAEKVKVRDWIRKIDDALNRLKEIYRFKEEGKTLFQTSVESRTDFQKH